MDSKLTSSEIEQIGLIAIVRTNESVDTMSIAGALAEGGIGALEITLNTPGALAAIEAIRGASLGTLRIGAGTILQASDARDAIDAGAEFIVTPTLQPDTIELCKSVGIPVCCGCLTPTEALSAHRSGADFIKVFPAESFGPGYIRALLAPLPFLKIVPTGGVNLKNLMAWFDAGCSAVAVGSSLVSKHILLDRDWAELRAVAFQYSRTMATVRSAA